jgi:hypothetical protein
MYLKDEKPELWKRSSLLNMGFYTTNMIKYGGFTGSGEVCLLLLWDSKCLTEELEIRRRKIHSAQTRQE